MDYITPKTDFLADDYYNAGDMNRVAGNILYLAGLLADSGYPVELLPFSGFTMRSLPYLQVINALEDNLERLRRSVPLNPRDYLPAPHWYPDMDERFDGNPDFTDANRWEMNLELLRRILVSLRAGWIFCGVSSCGSDYDGQLYCGGDDL